MFSIDKQRTGHVVAPRCEGRGLAGHKIQMGNRIVEIEMQSVPRLQQRAISYSQRRMHRPHIVGRTGPCLPIHVRLNLHADPMTDIAAVERFLKRGSVASRSCTILHKDISLVLDTSRRISGRIHLEIGS